ncbi:MAG TPA: permease [Lachnospiraceae bacterium]|nr:permease [Lachnospiraceae bacterium]
MQSIILFFGKLIFETILAVIQSLMHNWLVLLITILVAVLFKTYVNCEKLSKLLLKQKNVSIFASVGLGAFTPFCACGTAAIIIGMLTTTLPWGAIMSFLTSSPIMSPEGFVMISGILGLRFAVGLTIASVIIGLASGFITNIIERKTNFLDNQTRYSDRNKVVESSCSCSTEKSGSGCCQSILEKKEPTLFEKLKLKELADEFINLGLKQILLFFSVFVAVGFMIDYFIPATIIDVLFGASNFFAVPLASLIGLPLYITTESGIPIIQSMIQSGASEGATLSFMITGSATSAWVVAGLSTFLKKRAIGLYVAFIFTGGILAGYIYDFVLLFIKR